MIDAYEIGIRLALDNGVSAGLAEIQRDLSALDAAIARSAASLVGLRELSGGLVSAAALPAVRVPVPTAREARPPEPDQSPPSPEPKLSPPPAMIAGDRQSLPQALDRPRTEASLRPQSAAAYRVLPDQPTSAPTSSPATVQPGRPKEQPLSASPLSTTSQLDPTAREATPVQLSSPPTQYSLPPLPAPQPAPPPAAPVIPVRTSPPPPPFVPQSLVNAPAASFQPVTTPPRGESNPALLSVRPSASPLAPLASRHPLEPPPPATATISAAPPIPAPAMTAASIPPSPSASPPRAVHGTDTVRHSHAPPARGEVHRVASTDRLRDDPKTSTNTQQHGGGDIYFEGAAIGRWLDNRLARAASRPPAGSTAFDPRLSPTWPGPSTGAG